jgi:hypothetical protein
MFQWDKSINAINVPASKVIHLFRSMREVQLALPGVSAQQASAYLCQYQGEGGVGTVAVFHLHKSRMMAFYFSDPRFVPEEKSDSVLDQGLNLVESMGFRLTDQDIHLLNDADQEMLWASLPIKAGLVEEDKGPPATVPAKKMKVESDAIVAATQVDGVAEVKKKKPVPASDKPVKPESPTVEPGSVVAKDDPEASAENVDDLLAAVEAMRAKRPGLKARRLPPSTEEMARRKLQLRETIGRILGSL